MNRYIVLFRGINVGGRNKITMKELKAVLVKEGYEDVQTYIQSGNVIVSSETIPATIEDLVEEQFGFRPALMILSECEFLDSVAANPFEVADGKLVHCYFCAEQPQINEEKLLRYQSSTEQIAVVGRCCFLSAPDGIGRSKLVANIESILGVPATGRNFNTIFKLKEMLAT